MSNQQPKITPKDFLGYIFGLKKEIVSAVETTVGPAKPTIPMDEDGNGIPDWLEELDSADEGGMSDFEPKANDSLRYPDWLTQEVGFMTDHSDIEEPQAQEIPTTDDITIITHAQIEPEDDEDEVDDESEDNSEIEESTIHTLKDALTYHHTTVPEMFESEEDVIHTEASDKIHASVMDTSGVTIGVDVGGEDIHVGQDARTRHTYVVGKTGMGKTSLLENMIMQDIKAGRGVGLIDPHGDLYQRILEQIPRSRTNDVVLFDASDTQYPVGFNILENNQNQLTSLIASSMIGVFKKIFGYSWGPRMEYILRNATLTLLEQPHSTLLSLALILTDADYRRKVVSKIDNPFLKKFWEEEFLSLSPSRQAEFVNPILNKIGQFLSIPLIRNIVAQPQSSFSPRWVMDKNKIFLANLSKGKVGEDVSEMLGSMLVTKFQLDAMSRADMPEADRSTFYMYIDEFQNFATESFTNILSESRKYGLALTLAHQYIGQLDQSVQDAIFGNVASIVSFQVGHGDAKVLAPVYGSQITSDMLTEVPKYQFFTRTRSDDGKEMLTGSIYPPKSLTHIPNTEGVQKTLRVTREKFAKEREFVEEKLRETVS